MFIARHMPCSDCGASVEQAARDKHICDHERWLDYQLFHCRHELSAFEVELAAYFDTPRGRFDLWYAERHRQRG
jgi:hypothetical protein